MLNYQSTSFHDALAARRLFNLRPAPEFLAWLEEMGVYRDNEPAAISAPARRQLMQSLEASLASEQKKIVIGSGETI
jgi:ethanolamine ammonia-lyase large subunit